MNELRCAGRCHDDRPFNDLTEQSGLQIDRADVDQGSRQKRVVIKILKVLAHRPFVVRATFKKIEYRLRETPARYRAETFDVDTSVRRHADSNSNVCWLF